MSDYEVTSFGAVLDHVETASVNEAWWSGRTGAGTARERRAASDAVTEIDAALRKLHQLRARLVQETVSHDTAVLDQYDAFDTYAENIKAARP